MKINITDYKNGIIHFIGCGGAGMVGLVQIMYELGYNVTCSDMTESDNTRMLESLGIKVVISHSQSNIPDIDSTILIVRSSAVADDNPEYVVAVNKGFQCIRRGEMLANLADLYRKRVAVAGTHGKTSVTALLVHILKAAGMEPGYMIGGKVNTWKSSASAGDGSLFITESDESDGTQIHLKSSILGITNIEDDHSWSVGGSDVLMENFAKIANNAERVVYNVSDPTQNLLSGHPDKIPVIFEKSIYSDKTDWGDFQKENANLAVCLAVELGVDEDLANCEVRKFPGVYRRMTTHYEEDDFILIEDYAHHPTEVKAAVSALRERFPDRRLRIVFQPHRYARLEKYIDEFACELRKADKVVIVPVFAAWTETGEVNSANLAEKIGEKALLLGDDWAKNAEKVVGDITKPEVLAVFGAGDVEKIIPEIMDNLKNTD
jgi:UDP-N-acetylmuramate--alanine ligase